MNRLAATALVLMLMLVQGVLARSAGSGAVLCLGSLGAGQVAVESDAGPRCCHEPAHGSGPAVPVPVEPHDDGCPCIDVPVPVPLSRTDSITSNT